MQQPAQPLNQWLVAYIEQHHRTQSRYAIDKHLIQAGYNPVEIEAVWQTIEHPPKVAETTPQVSPITRVLYIFGAMVFIGCAYLSFLNARPDRRVLSYSVAFLMLLNSINFFIRGLVPNSPFIKRIIPITIGLAIICFVIAIIFLVWTP